MILTSSNGGNHTHTGFFRQVEVLTNQMQVGSGLSTFHPTGAEYRPNQKARSRREFLSGFFALRVAVCPFSRFRLQASFPPFPLYRIANEFA